MMKTTDGGATWINVPISTLEILTSVFFLNANKGYVVDEGGDILKTINGGLTWTNDSSGTWNNLASVFFTDSTTGYAVGGGGTILKIGNGGTDFIEEHKPTNAKFTISPNPAKDKCKVQSAMCNIKSIEIFNLDGKKVYGSEFSAGTGSAVDLDFDLPPGIYFMKIRHEKGISVQKLIVE
jgi:hypothetical protein